MKAYDVRGIRREFRMSQTELARLLGWNPEALGDVEAGRIGIDEETHRKVLAAIKGVASDTKVKNRKAAAV